MTTVNDIVIDALEITGLKSPWDDIDTAWQTVGRRRLNSIIDGWNVSKIKGYTQQKITSSISTFKQTYTIGSGGDIDANRPVKIERAFITTLDNIKSPLEIVTFNEFNDYTTGTQLASEPLWLWYDAKDTLGEINLYPTPTSNFNLELYCLLSFGKYSAPTDVVTLPDGYERLLTYQLAVELCSHAGKQAPADVRMTLSQIRSELEAVNFSAWMPELKIVSNSIPVDISKYGTYISRGI